jgi:plasmid stabilization system protein ParE
MNRGEARDEGESGRLYAVEFTDPAAAEADAAYLWLSQRSPELAYRWYGGLLREVQRLETLPNRCALAPENDLFPDTEVRQYLYRLGRLVYRVVFFLVDADGGGMKDNVRILHVRHAGQGLPERKGGSVEDLT